MTAEDFDVFMVTPDQKINKLLAEICMYKECGEKKIESHLEMGSTEV